MPEMHAEALAILRGTPAQLEATLAQLPHTTLRWRPAPDKWSILEVLGHMLDEEVDDFRARVFHAIDMPGTKAPPIDPERSVRERRHQEAESRSLLQRFRREREISVGRLLTVTPQEWERTARLGDNRTATAREIFAAWTYHDLLHLAQINRLRGERLAELAAPLPLDYAGGALR